MITESPYSNNLRPALAYVNDRPERASRWPERWMIHRPDGSFAPYLVNWEIRLTGDVQPSTTRLRELPVPDVMTARSLPQPANEDSRFLEWLHE
jgi:hypothetical protein